MFVGGMKIGLVFIRFVITKTLNSLSIESSRRDRPIRPKPDDRINKNHMTEYFLPYDRINRKKDDRIICLVYPDI